MDTADLRHHATRLCSSCSRTHDPPSEHSTYSLVKNIASAPQTNLEGSLLRSSHSIRMELKRQAEREEKEGPEARRQQHLARFAPFFTRQ